MENESIYNMINGKTAEIRRLAAQGLLEIGTYDSDTLKAFSYGLKDADRGVKDICAQVLMNLPDEYKATAAEFIAPFIDSDNIELRNLAGDILIKLGIYSVESVLNFTSHSDHYVRQFAIDILANVGDKRIIEDIYSLLQDKNNNVVSSAIDALGNLGAEMAIDKFEQIYQNVEEFRPMIIEAYRKIGGPKVEELLINKLSNEKDIFLQIACIDALAFVGNDVALCDDLLSKLTVVQEEVRGILLKTIFAISFRQGFQIHFPINLRFVALSAMNDSDVDVRIAGLIALGNEYFEDEVSYLINEILEYINDTQTLILNNLLIYCKPVIIEKFLREYSAICHYDQKHIEFFTLLQTLIPNGTFENIETFYNILFELILSDQSGFSTEVIEILYYSDAFRTVERLKNLLVDKEYYNKKEIFEIIYRFKFIELYDFLINFSEEDIVLKEYAQLLLKKIEEDKKYVEEDEIQQDA